MKYFFILMTCLAALRASPIQSRELNRSKGQVLILPEFFSVLLGNKRALRIYLPPHYDQSKEHYPVLYMHDAQNLFDKKTSYAGTEWEVDESMDRLISERKIRPTVVVGLDNTGISRINEYTPTRDLHYGGGRGELYLRFIEEELMPYIESRYRVLKGPENTYLIGSSLGGLISFYAGLTRPMTFGGVGCLSGSLWWDNKHLINQVQLTPSHRLPPTLIYLDAGGINDNLGDTLEMREALLSKGRILGKNLFFVHEPDGRHNEAAWARRFPLAATFLLKN